MNRATRFICRHPEKYAGDPSRIFARSKWEAAYMNALDLSNLVHKWTSEPKNLNISYVSPIDKKVHKYWPDFLVQYTDGTIEILEIKPLKEVLPSHAGTHYDKLMLIKNRAKWEAAEHLAKSIGGRFRVITEQQLFRRKSTKSPKKPRGTKPTRRTVK